MLVNIHFQKNNGYKLAFEKFVTVILLKMYVD